MAAESCEEGSEKATAAGVHIYLLPWTERKVCVPPYARVRHAYLCIPGAHVCVLPYMSAPQLNATPCDVRVNVDVR